ncbi:putative NAD(+) ADP-ribosyltransferase [Rosa chinensis]|uniref:Poly [ADP-ribose] polymerase n=1 Tax=Rosa chinensis TaxID=74649 RepID=A0A2P6PDC2_ROSCH|nr:putative NAD(+) ADP-ribosyltransferase [Rosa chinensis]
MGNARAIGAFPVLVLVQFFVIAAEANTQECSRFTNFVGILSQGLRIAPPEAPATGYMFGKGIYFADLVSKSAQYCYTDKKNPVGLMLLSEVALGEIHELKKATTTASGHHLTTMGQADLTLTAPLLSPPPPLPSDQPHLNVTVHDDDNNGNGSFRNPFAFLGSGGFKVPISTTADPFKNHNLKIGGVYEWLKIGVFFPIAILRLVIFGVSLLIGFVATKLALLAEEEERIVIFGVSLLKLIVLLCSTSTRS